MGQPVIKSIPCPIHKAAVAHPDNPALTENFQNLTYAQLDTAIDRVVNNFRQIGITSGDILAVLADNSVSYAFLFHAAFRLGFTLMPLNTRLTVQDWKGQIDQAHCRNIIVGDGYNLPGCDSISLDQIVSEDIHPASEPINQDYPLDREALIIFSSGSRGASRGAVLTWKNLYYSALGAASVLKYQPNDQWLAVLPYFHVGGISILFRAALTGCSVHIMSRFDADQVIGIIDNNKKQYLSVVPTMLRELILKDAHDRLRHLKAIIVGGAPFDEYLRHEAIERKLPVLTTYGMTETSSMVALLSPDSPPDKLLTAGKVLPYRELMIADPHGQALPPNQSGRIMVRGEVLFSRYLNQDRSISDTEGWFETGDIGRIDPDGFLTVTGRADNIIISGGENIDLNQIEQALSAIEGVIGVAVLARNDKKWGQRPIAIIEVTDKTISEAFIRDGLRERISAIMMPDHIIITDKLPRTGSGKYDRPKLREIYKDIIDGDD